MGNEDLKKSLYQAFQKALGSKQGQAHAAQHIAEDVMDPNMIAQAPANHIPVAKENVLHKDNSPAEIQQQKQAQAEAKLGMPPKMPAMKKVGYGALMVNQDQGMEAPEKGVGKLRKFMEKCQMKKSRASERRSSEKGQKGVHTSGGFSGLEEKGQSQAGRNYERSKEKQPNEYLNRLYEGKAKATHEEKLQELKEMPKPKLPK